jgi:tetratricopeptide (TPR) repeat protein
MKKFLLSVALAFWFPAAMFAQDPVTLPEASPHATVSQAIGITEVSVAYCRPSVAKREIWGRLVPYGYTYQDFGTSHSAPWRAGANENTVISFQHDVTVAGQPLKAGKYGLAMAISPDAMVTVIFSKDTESWGTFFYDQANDALRVDVKWEDAPFREQLSYDFSDVTNDSAVLALSWERKRIPIPLKTNTTANVIANLKNELRGKKGFSYQAWLVASRYLSSHEVELPLALEWAETAADTHFIGERNFATIAQKALVLEKMNRPDDAKPVVADALRLGTVREIHQFGRQFIAMGKSERALEVFKSNAEQHPNMWPVHYGLARGYSANGNYQAALEALLQAQNEVPTGNTQSATAVRLDIEKLKRGENIN